MIKWRQKTETKAAPIVCDICGDEVAAQMKGKRFCLKHYEQNKQEKSDALYAHLMQGIRDFPEWQPQPQETSKQYVRRMMRVWRPMIDEAVKRHKTKEAGGGA